MGITMSTTSGLVSKLVDRGLVARSSSQDDRRQIPLQLTEAGQQLAGELAEFTRPFLDGLAAELGEELERVVAALETLTAAGGAGETSMKLPRPRLAGLTHAFRSLKNRNYRLFWFGQLISLAGTWMQDVALGWLVLDITDSAVALGLTMTIRFLPALLFSLHGGVLADRLPKRQTLIIAQATQLVVALVLAVLTSTELVTVAIIYVLAGLRGMVDAIEGPTRQAFVPEMVGMADLPNAVGLNSTLFNGARIVGPAIGAAVIGTLGMAACFYLNAATFLAVIVALAMMRPSELHSVASGSPGQGPASTARGPALRPLDPRGDGDLLRHDRHGGVWL